MVHPMHVALTLAGFALAAAGVVVGAFWEDILVAAPPANAVCEPTPGPGLSKQQLERTHGVIEFHFENRGDDVTFRLCIHDEHGVKRFQMVLQAEAGEKDSLFSLEFPIGEWSYGVNVDDFGTESTSDAAAGVRMQWCPKPMVRFNIVFDIRQADGRVHSQGPTCLDEQAPTPSSLSFSSDGGAVMSEIWKEPRAVSGAMIVVGALVAVSSQWSSLHGLGSLLFTRLQRPRLLEHRVREQILALVTADPGIHRAALRQRLSLADGQARHHLDVLVRGGILVAVTTPGHTHYFLSGQHDPGRLRIMAALRNPTLQRLLRLVRDHPDSTLRELAQRLNCTRSSISKQARELGALGLVQARRNGRQVRLIPSPG